MHQSYQWVSLQWRYNGYDGVSNHQPYDCLLNLYSGADQRKHQSSVLLAFVRGIHRGPVNSPHKWPVTRKMFPFDDVIMSLMNGDAQIISIMDCCYWITRFAIHFLQGERSSRLLSIAALGAHCVLVFYSPINDKRAVVGYQKHNTGNDIFDIINVCCKRVFRTH